MPVCPEWIMNSGMTVRRRRRDPDGSPSTAEQRTLAEQAFEGIFNLILSGELPLGGVVNEANLAERFQISRGPVREAVQRLQGLRLITREPFMRAHVVSLSETDVRDIFQLRQAVEGIACRLCADVLPGAELDDMLLRLERNRRDRENGGDTFDIHITIARACGNARIAQLLCEDLYYLLRWPRATARWPNRSCARISTAPCTCFWARSAGRGRRLDPPSPPAAGWPNGRMAGFSKHKWQH
jgi:DNA-binding GntR family transcriptional regulator